MMMRIFFKSLVSTLLGGFLLIANAAFAQEATGVQELPNVPREMHLFLLIGQSNMAGRGKVEAADSATHPRIWMLDRENTWVLARDPVHFDKPAIAGVGLASEFARTLAQDDPQVTVGLIPCAFGGTSLEEWKAGGELYRNAIERTKIASRSGTLQGILWHQGEADSAPERVKTYPARFASMIAQMRTDLNAPDVPVVVGELGHYRPSFGLFNAMLPELIKQVPRAALVSSESLTDKGDNLHFDSPSLRTFGRRYAQAWKRIQQPFAKNP